VCVFVCVCVCVCEEGECVCEGGQVYVCVCVCGGGGRTLKVTKGHKHVDGTKLKKKASIQKYVNREDRR
jgi:hypothetical protein